MNVLVTGGAGFIGSHLCERLLTKGDFVTCIDNFNNYYDPQIKRKNLELCLKHSEFSLVEDDILNFEAMDELFSKNKFDMVVHLAARAGVRPSIEQPRLYQQVNVEGTGNLLELCVQYNVPKIVMASSSSVYGNNKKVPFSEDDNVDFPVSPYAATKKACELLGYTYHHLHGLAVTCLRFFTVYGPRQRPDMAIHKFTKLIDQGQEVPFFGDGSSRRDYTYITDILDGIEKSMQNCSAYHIYNLGESQTIQLSDLLRQIESALGKKAVLNRMPNQPGDVNITYADIRKAKSELNYAPEVSVEEGIPLFVDWYQKTIQEKGKQ